MSPSLTYLYITMASFHLVTCLGCNRSFESLTASTSLAEKVNCAKRCSSNLFFSDEDNVPYLYCDKGSEYNGCSFVFHRDPSSEKSRIQLSLPPQGYSHNEGVCDVCITRLIMNETLRHWNPDNTSCASSVCASCHTKVSSRDRQDAAKAGEPEPVKMNSYVFLDDEGAPYVQQFFSDSLANPLYFVRPQRWASFLARMCDNCLDK